MTRLVFRSLCARRLAGLALAAALASVPLAAQSSAKKPLTVDDYARWRSISGQEISGDGHWVAYVLQLTNVPEAKTKPVLHVLNLQTNADVEIGEATGGVFSPDSKWIAYHVDPARERRGRAGRGGGPAQPASTPEQPSPAAQPQSPAGNARNGSQPPLPPRRVELRNLESGAVQSWDDIESFMFAPDSSLLVLKRRPAEGEGRRGAAGANQQTELSVNASAKPDDPGKDPAGTDVLLVDVRTGRHQLLGSVHEIAFDKAGDRLAYDVDDPAKDANGVFVLDLHSGRTTALDTDAKLYDRLAWSEDGKALAVLKGTDVDKQRERDNVLMTFAPASGAGVVAFDRKTADDFPSGWVVSDRAPLTWSDDDTRVFFGAKPQVPVVSAERKSTDDVADVDIWNTADDRIQSAQMIRAAQDRNFTFRQAFDVAHHRYVKLADDTMHDVDVAEHGRWAVGRDTRGYISDYKPAAADIYRIDTTTGRRTLMMKDQLIGSAVFGISPDGHYYLYWKDGKFQAYDLDAGASRTLGAGTAVNFVDTDFDHPGPKPAFGMEGFTADGHSVIVEHEYDLWRLPLDGSAPRDLTNGIGAKNETRFRYVRTDPPDATLVLGAEAEGGEGGFGGPGRRRALAAREKPIDLSKPILLSAYGVWTKKAGFSELSNGTLKPLVYEDAYFSEPVKATGADRYLFTRETYVEFPDLRVSGLDFKEAKKITDANPQQSEYLWGHRVLIDFKDRDGHRLQALLSIPDDYQPGEKRPMLVNFYEKNSQNLHRYNAPSYISSMGSSPMQAVSDGYLALVPDVYFHTGASHSDVLQAVEAATRKVIAMGYADPKRIGLNGHSYGGEAAAFIGTRSRLFAAVGMGAGVVDLYYDFNQNWGWSYQVTGGSGANGDDYYLYGQGREGVSPWDNPQMYMFESALSHVPEVTAPFLIMHGTADPTVAFSNGLDFYNALRYNGKKAVLLAYPGEGHHLDGMANRRDLTIRYFQFFDHYLKGAPAPEWLAKGVPFLKKGEPAGMPADVIMPEAPHGGGL